MKRAAEIEDASDSLPASRPWLNVDTQRKRPHDGRLQPRIAQIEKSKNVTITLDVCKRAGGQLEVSVLRGGKPTYRSPEHPQRVPQRFNALKRTEPEWGGLAEPAERRPESKQVSGVKPPRKTRNTAFFLPRRGSRVRIPSSAPKWLVSGHVWMSVADYRLTRRPL